ncbi:MAG: methionyl-tRNA formyltransferase, partial [bacterium]|nr:methionyl-tRNA formyltransferase [bacterium]
KGLRVVEPARLRPFAEQAKTMQADAFAVASYGRILPGELLAVPPRGAFNVHPSLLPLYRGATPLQSALLDGARETGVTIFLMDAGMDTGEIVLQECTPISPDEEYGMLHDRLAARGAELLLQALALAADGPPPAHAQCGDEREIARTVTHPFSKRDRLLDWTQPARRIVDRIRAFAPQPAAQTSVRGHLVKCLRARLVLEGGAEAVRPGTVLDTFADELRVAAGEGGVVALQRVIPQDRGAMSGADFARAVLARWCDGEATSRFD